MPFLNLALLERLAREPRDYDVLVPLTPGESRQRSDGMIYQTLHAVYSKICLDSIERQLQTGRRQVIGFFPDVKVRTISVGEISLHDPAMISFFNANNPAALALAAEMEAKNGHQPS
jgi:molybdopterin-guanine dinucleotide biosynthesis protein A